MKYLRLTVNWIFLVPMISWLFIFMITLAMIAIFTKNDEACEYIAMAFKMIDRGFVKSKFKTGDKFIWQENN